MLPSYVYHADWGNNPGKRWIAKATLQSSGTYFIEPALCLTNHAGLLNSIRAGLAKTECAVVGFDFPIGVPAAFAHLAGVTQFKSFLRELGRGAWSQFYEPALTAAEISVHRPFYPQRPGGTKQIHLLSALGLTSIDQLRRECERSQISRRAACPLFWTLGANQVGKGAITGWRDVIVPSLSAGETDVLLWPFDGALVELTGPGNIVIVETYPAECYGWIFERRFIGKGKLDLRKSVAPSLLQWAQASKVRLRPELEIQIAAGFPEGDDAFDAVIGIFGMLDVVMGRRSTNDPQDAKIRAVEGWIIGQAELRPPALA